MALDPLRLLPHALADVQVRELSLTPGLNPLGHARLALYSTASTPVLIDCSRRALQQPEGTIYATLQRQGVVAVALGENSTDNHSVQLAGGSVCRVELTREDQRWMVRKRTTPSLLDRNDAFLRHKAEALWLASPGTQATRLFPPTQILQLDSQIVSWQMDFFPRYTLGELLTQARVSGIELASYLTQLISRLAAELYCREKTGARQRSYFDIVERRYAALASRDPVYHSIWNDGLELNGERIEPLGLLLRRATRFAPQLAAGKQSECHGDLIFDDILPTPELNVGDTVLVDPNPSNSSALVDLGKILMNTTCYYDLVYRDLMELSLSRTQRPPKMDLRFADSHYVTACDHATLHIFDQLPAIASEMNISSTPFVIQIQAALHGLAIPVFHDVHHGKPERALAFTALGMYRLNQAVLRKELASSDLSFVF